MINILEEQDNFKKNASIESVCLKEGSREQTPLFSILIPTFRRVDLLKEAVESACGQAFDPGRFEVIVMDNQYDPQSETAKWIQTVDAGNLFYYQNRENLGAAGNWNRGFELARGKWVMMLHDDDLLHQDACSMAERMIGKLGEENLAVIFPERDVIGENKEAIRPSLGFRMVKAVKKWVFRLAKKPARRWKLICENYRIIMGSIAPTCGTIFCRGIVLREGGFCDKYKSTDLVFALKLCDRHRCYFTDEVWGAYRVSANDSLNVRTRAALANEAYGRELFFQQYFAGHSAFCSFDQKVKQRIMYYLCVHSCRKGVYEEEAAIFQEALRPELQALRPNPVNAVLYKLRSGFMEILGCIMMLTREQDESTTRRKR